MQRNEIDLRYQWDLGDIFPSKEAYEKEVAALKEEIPALTAYSGVFCRDAASLLECVEKTYSLARRTEAVYAYARMNQDQDNGDASAQAMHDEAGKLMLLLSESTAYQNPELIALGTEKVEAYLKEEKGLLPYEKPLRDILRMEKHTLSPKEESLLSGLGEVMETAQKTFTLLTNADMDFPMVKSGDGKEVQLGNGNFTTLLEDPDPQVRKDIYEKFYAVYAAHNNTLASLYSGNVSNDLYTAKTRGFASCLEESLYPHAISLDVYNTLLKVVHSHTDGLRRYMKLRKKSLGLDRYGWMDVYLNAGAQSSLHPTYDEGYEMVLDGLAPLGKAYIGDLRKARDSRWIDVYTTPGKSSGAYSWGTYDSHPYVLLNYTDTLNSVFTIAHEMGHSMHTLYSSRTQPYQTSDYSLFVAEVASTTNEAILMHALRQKLPDRNDQLYLMHDQLEQFRSTVFRQTMFAEFEFRAHEMAAKGGALTGKVLSDLYAELLNEYYGDSVEMDDCIRLEWSRIPHFYRSFYVYQYATGYLAATALSASVLSGEKGREDYLRFLSLGSSVDPLDALRIAGVDMEKEESLEKSMTVFEELLSSLEKMSE